MLAKKYSWLPSKPKLVVIIPTTFIVVVGILMILYAWQLPPFFINTVVTNDAYVQSKTTLISPQVSGYVTEIYVKDFADVKKGQPILQIDKRIFTQKVQEAYANLQSAKSAFDSYDQNHRLHEANVAAKKAEIATAEAMLYNARQENNRVSKLVKRGSLSRRDFDNTQTALKTAQANYDQAKAQYQQAVEQLEAYKINKSALEAGVKKSYALLQLALIDLDNSLIKAPIDGKLGEVGARLGQFVTSNTGLTFIIPHYRWVIANFKETKMGKIKIGQQVDFSVDALGGKTFKGIVQEISPGTGSEFSSVKVNQATGNFIKIIQRVPVKIAIDPNDPRIENLRAGMSVVVKVYTK